VAIAISLVPPLSVVGLTLESGEPGQSLGALLLFGTNVAAIIAPGTAVLPGFRVRAVALDAGRDVGRLSTRTLTVIAALVVLVAILLGIGSYHVVVEQRTTTAARPIAERWAADAGWDVVTVAYGQGRLQIAAVGPAPVPDAGPLPAELSQAGLDARPRAALARRG
jgi:hypothetical protein